MSTIRKEVLMANKILLEMKYARVIMGLAKKLNIPPATGT